MSGKNRSINASKAPMKSPSVCGSAVRLCTTCSRFTFDVPLQRGGEARDELLQLLSGHTALLASLDGFALDAIGRLLGRWGMHTERCRIPEKLPDQLAGFDEPPLLLLIAPWPGGVEHWLDALYPHLAPGQRLLLVCPPEQCRQLPASRSSLHMLGLPQPVGVLQDDPQVLVVLGDFRLRREIATEHLLALHVHRTGIGRRGLQQCEERLKVQAEAFGEDEALGQRQPVEPQDEIARQLGPRARTRSTQVVVALGQNPDDVQAAFVGAAIAADQEDALVLADLLARSGEWSVQQLDRARGKPGRQCFGALRVSGRRVEDEPHPRDAGQEAIRSQDDRLDGGRVREREDDSLGRLADRRRGGRCPSAEPRQRVAVAGASGEADHVEARRHQVFRQRRAHQADADQTDRLPHTRPSRPRGAAPILHRIGPR